MRKLFIFAIGFLFITGLTSAGFGVKNPEPIKLLHERIRVTPTEFYIKKVLDDRSDQSPVAKLFLPETGSKPVMQPVDLYGGGYEAIRDFMLQGLPQNTSARPVNVRIKECNIIEAMSGENRVSGQINLVLQFDLARDSEAVVLTRYKSTVKYNRPVNSLTVVEPAFRQLLVNSLKFFNTWMNKEAPRNIELARGVKISFTDYLEQDADTVYFHVSRPLTWDDFRGSAENSKYVAAVFSSFGYDQRSELKDGIIQVELAMKVYVVKSASWVAPGVNDIYSLNHEQRHFDLVKLVAERFKEKLLSEKLSPDNYEGIINYEYLEFYREMNQRQKKYDSDTGHSTNQGIQQQWNLSIDNDLKAFEAGTKIL